jgi:alpha-tubulin suppressor-like RCC1 family protein
MAHTCAVSADGSLRCWGANASGQLGNGATLDRDAPVAAALTDVVGAGAAGTHTCARLGAGETWCWGANAFGQLGDGTPTPTLEARAALLSCP